MSISYYHIDSFASELFAGNPAGVCLLPAFPVNDVMQKIAAENRHSETAFVVARADGDRVARSLVVRFFRADWDCNAFATSTASARMAASTNLSRYC